MDYLTFSDSWPQWQILCQMENFYCNRWNTFGLQSQWKEEIFPMKRTEISTMVVCVCVILYGGWSMASENNVYWLLAKDERPDWSISSLEEAWLEDKDIWRRIVSMEMVCQQKVLPLCVPHQCSPESIHRLGSSGQAQVGIIHLVQVLGCTSTCTGAWTK